MKGSRLEKKEKKGFLQQKRYNVWSQIIKKVKKQKKKIKKLILDEKKSNS